MEGALSAAYNELLDVDNNNPQYYGGLVGFRARSWELEVQKEQKSGGEE